VICRRVRSSSFQLLEVLAARLPEPRAAVQMHLEAQMRRLGALTRQGALMRPVMLPAQVGLRWAGSAASGECLEAEAGLWDLLAAHPAVGRPVLGLSALSVAVHPVAVLTPAPREDLRLVACLVSDLLADPAVGCLVCQVSGLLVDPAVGCQDLGLSALSVAAHQAAVPAALVAATVPTPAPREDLRSVGCLVRQAWGLWAASGLWEAEAACRQA